MIFFTYKLIISNVEKYFLKKISQILSYYRSLFVKWLLREIFVLAILYIPFSRFYLRCLYKFEYKLCKNQKTNKSDFLIRDQQSSVKDAQNIWSENVSFTSYEYVNKYQFLFISFFIFFMFLFLFFIYLFFFFAKLLYILLQNCVFRLRP